MAHLAAENVLIARTCLGGCLLSQDVHFSLLVTILLRKIDLRNCIAYFSFVFKFMKLCVCGHKWTYFQHITTCKCYCFGQDFSDFIRSSGSCLGFVNTLRKCCLTQPQIVFHILSLNSSWFAVVDVCTYVVFMHVREKFLIFTFCTNSLNHIAY